MQYAVASPDSPKVALAHCGAGQALQRLDRHAEALEHFERALVRSERLQTTGIAWVAGPVHLAAARSAAQLNQLAEVREHCRQACVGTPAAGIRSAAAHLEIAALNAAGQFQESWSAFESYAGLQDIDDADRLELAMSIATAALTQQHAAIAYVAFRWYVEHADPNAPLPQALAGLGWSAALGADEPEVAARLLMDYARRFPKESDVPRAILAAAACHLRAKDAPAAAEALEQLIAGHAESTEAIDGLAQLAMISQGLQRFDRAIQVRDELLRRAPTHPQAPQFAAAQCAEATAKPQQLSTALGVLAQTTTDPQLIAFALRSLDESGRYELALDLIETALPPLLEQLQSNTPSGTPGYSTLDTYVEFLGRHREWARLADHAEHVRLNPANTQLQIATQRWMIESLVEQRNHGLALDWLRELCPLTAAAQSAEAFDLHARWAELSLEHGSIEETRESLSALLALAAGPGQIAISQILQSQYEIRRSEFQAARERLQRLIAEKSVQTELAARAQWLIGQTHQMQRDFQAAIEAYRRVPDWQPDGPWLGLALLEAGKCFEQLGQTREAQTCYSSLVNRFQDGPLIAIARQRLAQLPQPSTLR
jgi:TolA-binding protein